jgi:hypothetical protein
MMAILFPVQADVTYNNAVWSKETPPLYRYSLYRSWDNSKLLFAFIGMNPSKADERFDDPTVRRCINFARREGAGRFIMLNVYGYRSTEAAAIRKVVDPNGSDNDFWLKTHVRDADVVVAAWGRNVTDRGKEVLDMLKGLNTFHCLGLNLDGSPKHPLYVKADTPFKILQEIK